MIGKIKGILAEVEGNIGLVETVSGIFYEVYLTSSVLSSVRVSEAIAVYVYHHIREDTQILFGFKNRNEHHVFKLLLSVGGVGPKTAFTVVSFSSVDSLIQAITNNDVDYFSKIPGLGKKTAMKILLEMSQKLNSEFRMENLVVSDDDKVVIDALVSLGFKSTEAKSILAKLPRELSLEDKIKDGIKLATNPKK